VYRAFLFVQLNTLRNSTDLVDAVDPVWLVSTFIGEVISTLKGRKGNEVIGPTLLNPLTQPLIDEENTLALIPLWP
jgi:hypothetical protein